MRINKRGIQLSINTLVTLILGLVVLGSGYVLITSLGEEVPGIVKSVSASTQQAIERELGKGSLFSIPDNSRETTYDTQEIVGLGFKNKVGKEMRFRPIIDKPDFISASGTQDTSINDITPFWYDYEGQGEDIKLGANEIVSNIPVSITIPKSKPKGTYTWNARILYDKNEDNNFDPATEQYGPTIQIRLTVK